MFVGNAVLEGAKLVIISNEARKEIGKNVRSIEYVELASQPNFNDEFAQSMIFWSVV